jgi:hypothetical protein
MINSKYEWLRKKSKEIDKIVDDVYCQLDLSPTLNADNAVGIGSRLIIKSFKEDFKEFNAHHLQYVDQKVNKDNFERYIKDIDAMLEKLKEIILDQLTDHISSSLAEYIQEEDES